MTVGTYRLYFLSSRSHLHHLYIVCFVVDVFAQIVGNEWVVAVKNIQASLMSRHGGLSAVEYQGL